VARIGGDEFASCSRDHRRGGGGGGAARPRADPS
jgi:hypothetical protein